MLGIAVLGCGRIGAMHAANISAHPRARLAAVQDINSAAAEAVSASTGAPVMDSAAAVFASRDVDAVLTPRQPRRMPICWNRQWPRASPCSARSRSISAWYA
jgi:hypothetical protein